MAIRGPYAKGTATREEILDVALDLFLRKGYDRTSVREIARMAGLSQAGLLHHFSTKEELLVEVLRRRDELSREAYQATPDEDLSVDGLLSVVGHNAQEPGLVRLYVAMSAESTDEHSAARGYFEERYRWLRTGVAQDIRRQQDSGEVSADLDPEATAALLIAAADGLQIQWLLDPDGQDMGARLKQLWTALRQIP
jgi:AcrR family transcriptional regulator